MMPTDTPAAAASPLAVDLMNIVTGYHARRVQFGMVQAARKATAEVEALLAPVREAMQHMARFHVGVDTYGPFETCEDELCKRDRAALSSLSPQPPEAPR